MQAERPLLWQLLMVQLQESICQQNTTIFPSSFSIFSFICPFVHCCPNKYVCIYEKWEKITYFILHIFKHKGKKMLHIVSFRWKRLNCKRSSPSGEEGKKNKMWQVLVVLLSVHWRAFKWQARVYSVIKDRRGAEGSIRIMEVPSRRSLQETGKHQNLENQYSKVSILTPCI